MSTYFNGPSATVRRTVDGGGSWSRGIRLPFLGTVMFRSRRDGWLGRTDHEWNQQLSFTRDGGRTWRRRVLTPPTGWSGARVFPSVPMFFGGRGVLPVTLVRGPRRAAAFYVSEDAGRTWRVRSVRRVSRLPAPLTHHVSTAVASPWAWWVRRAPSTFEVTGDGGRHWHLSAPIEPPPGRHVTITALDARRAWVSGDALLATGDGGHSWRRLEPRLN